MDIPQYIRVMGLTVKVERPETILINGESYTGAWDSSDLTVEIKRDLPQECAEATLFHEILHMADYNGALNEDQTEQISRSLYAIFKDNDWLK